MSLDVDQAAADRMAERLLSTRAFSVRTLAERLDLSERKVRELLADRVIPSFKIGGSVRVAATDLEAYLRERRHDD